MREVPTAPTTNALRLIDVGTVAAKYGCAPRTVFRLADQGRIPTGIKLGALRRWNEAVIDRHISDGCPSLRPAKGGAR